MTTTCQTQPIPSLALPLWPSKPSQFSCTYPFIPSYLFVGMFAPDVITFIIVMIMSALDFWTVKNVTGRLLVGLRWWSDYDEKGDEIWRF